MGPYALVAGPIMQSVVLTAILWSMQPWRPRSFISARAARDIWSFSGGVLGFAVVNYAGRNADNLLIGRIFGAGGARLLQPRLQPDAAARCNRWAACSGE